jgi:tetratricopeptide (TPR) repeat protein
MQSVRSLRLLLVGTLLCGSAYAQAPASSSYATSKKQGDDYIVARKYEEALAAYDTAYGFEANPVIHYNRYSVLSAMARYPEALDALERFDREAPQDLKSKVPTLSQLIADLRNAVGSLDVEVSVPSARVMLRGVDITNAKRPMRVNAGPGRIEVFAEGYETFTSELTLKGNERTNVQAKLVPKATTLAVSSGVSGATVFIDAKPLGLLPIETRVEPGSHTLRVALKGYEDAFADVSLVSGERKVLRLDPVASSSILGKWWFWAGVGVVVVGTGVALTVYAVNTESARPDGSGFTVGSVGVGPSPAQFRF